MSMKPTRTAAGNGDAPQRADMVHPLRPISFGQTSVSIDRLHHWVKSAPDRIFMAEREAGGGWRRISYAQLLAASRRIASALLARGLSAEKPVVILSGNSIDHVLVAFGALYAGIPFCPVSPAYSLVSKDYGKLGHLMKLLTPGLVFTEDATALDDAVRANVPKITEVVASRGEVPGHRVTKFSELLGAPEHPGLDAAHDAIGPDTIAKFLLTSGSTGSPKAVINTQRMLFASQGMPREPLAFREDEPTGIVDWLPWNHTFGGNHNIGLTLFNGGSMYLDEGKPMPGGIEETVRNLREISPTVYFNVPKRYEPLRPYPPNSNPFRAKSSPLLPH